MEVIKTGTATKHQSMVATTWNILSNILHSAGPLKTADDQTIPCHIRSPSARLLRQHTSFFHLGEEDEMSFMSPATSRVVNYPLDTNIKIQPAPSEATT